MPSNSKKMTFNLVVAAFLLSLGIEQVFGRQALAKRFAALRSSTFLWPSFIFYALMADLPTDLSIRNVTGRIHFHIEIIDK